MFLAKENNPKPENPIRIGDKYQSDKFWFLLSKLKTNKNPKILSNKAVCIFPRDAGKFGGVEIIQIILQSLS